MRHGRFLEPRAYPAVPQVNIYVLSLVQRVGDGRHAHFRTWRNPCLLHDSCWDVRFSEKPHPASTAEMRAKRAWRAGPIPDIAPDNCDLEMNKSHSPRSIALNDPVYRGIVCLRRRMGPARGGLCFCILPALDLTV